MRMVQKLRRNCLLAAIVFGCSGCGTSSLDYEKSSELEGGAEKVLPFDASSSEQKVKIEVISPDPIDVSVYMAKDKNKSVVKKSAVRNESFVAAIPANEDFVISLFSPKKTTAFVKAKTLGQNYNKDVPKADEPEK
jgi:hypothetical protein